MSIVFIGGSRKIIHLPKEVKEKIDDLMNTDGTIYIGDENGTDKRIQKYLAEKGYEKVVIFYIESLCRNNIGKWETREINKIKKKKDFEYYAIKDLTMLLESDYGLMIWDGISKGTLRNIIYLVSNNKQVFVYVSPEKSMYELNTHKDLDIFLFKADKNNISKELISAIKEINNAQVEIKFI
jgi:hypothetical protein